MDDDMQAPPPIPPRSESRERGREQFRKDPLSSSTPRLHPSPFTPTQTSSQPTSRKSSLHPRPTTPSSPNRASSTSPYPSPFISTAANQHLFHQHTGADTEEGLHRQPSTRVETATTIRQPSFPQFRNSIITKPSVSLITRPGIVHVQPGQALAHSSSPAASLFGSSTASPSFGSPLICTTPDPEGLLDPPDIERNREARVSVVNVSKSCTAIGSPAARTRDSARASFLAGSTTAVGSIAQRPNVALSHNEYSSHFRPDFNFIEAQASAIEKAMFFDMKVEQILGPRDERPLKEEGVTKSGLKEVKRIIGDMKSEVQRPRFQKKILDENEGLEKGKRLGQNMYSMSGETLDSGSELGMRGLNSPDHLMGVDGDYLSPSEPSEKAGSRRGGVGLGMGWWRRCLGMRR